MDHFQYLNGRLMAEKVPIERIAAEAGTPAYVYSTATLTRHYRVFKDAFGDLAPLVCYAVKANGSLAVVSTLAALGAGADVVSGGELAIALAAGVAPERIVFSGVGKSRAELQAAITADIRQINVESRAELDCLSDVAQELGRTARVALRINPDVDARTHAKIATGLNETKFGIEWTAGRETYAYATRLPGLALVGIAVHIGSQLTDLQPFEDAFRRVRDLIAMLRADGHRITSLDLGGGLGVPYGAEAAPLPDPAAYAAVVARTVSDLGCQLILEPGRVLVANAGLLVTRLLYLKEGATRTFAIVDAGMSDLLRPALYGATHQIVPVVLPAADGELVDVDVVGPVCETSDTFGTALPLPPLKQGDLLAIRTAGAYGATMASFYNARPLCAEVMVKEDEFVVTRPPIPWTDLMARERLPPWLVRDGGGRRQKAAVTS